MSYINNHNFPIVIISINDDVVKIENPLTMITQELAKHDYCFLHVEEIEQAVGLLKKEVGIGCVIINEFDDLKVDNSNLYICDIIKAIRCRNNSLPIFISSPRPILGRLPMEVIKEIHEYINVNEDTPKFIAGRIHLAMHQYIENLLPPYFNALKNYASDSPYYWDCPGHQGGVAYLKHPVGREFLNFFGENIMRADIGIATPEMGDWLEHKGVPGESEKQAARIFGADRTFYVIGGSSQSNQIVGHSLPLKGKIVLVDRNCHKSVNHELTVTEAYPVYFRPARNGFGIIGLISPDQFEPEAIRKSINASAIASRAKSAAPEYAIITNCTYDGLIYDVKSVTERLGLSTPRIKFDEAWYAYAKFHPLYRDRFAMDMPGGPEQPTLYAVQSTHKMLAAFSSASMIHVRSSARAPVNYEVFNQSFMMHGTTSPFYPIIASMDVATAMMDGPAGRTLIEGAIDDAINFRKTLVMLENKLKQDKPTDWFFTIWQPENVRHNDKLIPFINVSNDILASDATYWTLKSGDSWHGFGETPEGYAMLDPIKVTILCPGLNAQGEMMDFGIPAPVVSKYLDTQRIIPARNGDYNILILFALGSTQGKWNTLIDLLMIFKRHHDRNTPLKEVLPAIALGASCYKNMGLADLCREIHQANYEMDIAGLSDRACSINAMPVMTPSQAYECLVEDNTELVEVSQIKNRIVGVMVTPYPPGIPLIMPGEVINEDAQAIIDYLQALQEFGRRFPGFEHELQGVEIDATGTYRIRCIKEKSGINHR
ncbi:Orn/Lys/Arg decarboxylase N-terminal domain-containing protein [Serratia sp. NPDC078593]|uniref:Orn/Lys/Arg family decarboxylase n=1 Tax=unclassified Serratia (in: enterobacteria) TaxID=2647522 RepID=UPI0037D37214